MKKMLTLLLALTMIFSLVACSETPTEEPKTDTPTPTEATDNVDDDDVQEDETITDAPSSTPTATPEPEPTPSATTIEALEADKPKSQKAEDYDNWSAPAEITTTTVEELETHAENDIAKMIADLNTEFNALKSEITSYDSYVKNLEKVEAFYKKIEQETEKMYTIIQKYTVKYAELIMASDMTNKEKYNAFDDVKRFLYDDLANTVKDGIYDDLLEAVQDAFYDGVLEDQKTSGVSYSDWSDTHSDEYKNWSDSRSDIYSLYSDTRSDIYSFYSDIRSDLFQDKADRANKSLADYKADVEKLQ